MFLTLLYLIKHKSSPSNTMISLTQHYKINVLFYLYVIYYSHSKNYRKKLGLHIVSIIFNSCIFSKRSNSKNVAIKLIIAISEPVNTLSK